MHITAEEPSCQPQSMQLAALRYYFDRCTLEAHVISVLEAAHLEQGRGMLAGAPIFAVLTHQATRQVSGHCTRWGLSAQQVEKELPSMAELRRLTMPCASMRNGHDERRWILFAFAALAISLALSKDWERNLPLYSQ